MNLNSKILILGSNGMVGSSIVRHLQSNGYQNILKPSRKEINLFDGNSVDIYFKSNKPEYVFIAAAKVGGIVANSTQQVEFGKENILIQTNVFNACENGFKTGVMKKVLFLGSSCIYPRDCPQPIKEEYLLTGKLEETNHMYALSKIHGLKMCEAYKKQYGYNFISCMPTNLYGINDNFDITTSHVLPAIMRKMHDAKVNNENVTLWGDGTPRREFLYVDDLAEACCFLMNEYDGSVAINVGCGYDMTIKEVAEIIKSVVGYTGDIIWDSKMPNGTPRKLLDTSLIQSLGWKPKNDIVSGINKTYSWFRG